LLKFEFESMVTRRSLTLSSKDILFSLKLKVILCLIVFFQMAITRN